MSEVRAPVALFIHRRPELTRRTVDAIASARPSVVFVIADGPRPGRDEEEQCRQAREVALSADFGCEVVTDFSDENLGCRRRISSGIDWVFDQTEAAIILEDDCVASLDFFRFCDDLLDRYRDDDRVLAINGVNFQGGRQRGTGSYYFSRYPHFTGWATWGRAWRNHDNAMSLWPRWRDSGAFAQAFADPVERRYWRSIFDNVEDFDSWAFPWTASIFRRGGLVATPNRNLVANIGLGHDATNTAGATWLAVPIERLGPIQHPDVVAVDVGADRHTFEHRFGGRIMRPVKHPLAWSRARVGTLRRHLADAARRVRT